MIDVIEFVEEKQFIKVIWDYEQLDFYFMKFYELVQLYWQYFLIWMCYVYYRVVDDFLCKYWECYDICKEVFEWMYEVIMDIVGQYFENFVQLMQWEGWFMEVFYDEYFDGLNCYLVFVCFIFIYFNYWQFDKLKEKYDYIDSLFCKGQYYFWCFLFNYYGNWVLLYMKFQDYDKVEYYGYLLVWDKNSDYIYYVNNLSVVLLWQKKYLEVLQFMCIVYLEMKYILSFYNWIGFVVFYLKCFNYN